MSLLGLSPITITLLMAGGSKRLNARMNAQLIVALGQLDFLVGDVDGNVQKILSLPQSRDAGVDLCVFPELALTGYPPEDLLLRPGFMSAVEDGLERIRQASGDTAIVVGHPERGDGCRFNSVSVFRRGERLAIYRKHCLPNYGVFDERRYFDSGEQASVFDLNGVKIGLTVCEDGWEARPSLLARQQGAELLVNVNASPFHQGKQDERLAVHRQRVEQTGLPTIYVNCVGGQDELVFDGGSFVLDAQGRCVAQLARFGEQVGQLQMTRDARGWAFSAQLSGGAANPQSDLSEIYQALVLGVRDYVRKNGFSGAVLGLSGGIDSALTLAIAVDALGADNVEAVMMPSIYTAGISRDDAAEQARRMGVAYQSIAIKGVVEAFASALAPAFSGLESDVTEENIQARSRGVILMALSNKTGKLLLTTGNKSEMAVGYATLYGDMSGGFAPLKDCPKTLVYALAEHRNRKQAVIPRRVIEREPSAELRPDQKDSDSLPDYDVLDAILERFVERDMSVEKIVSDGFDAALVRRVVGMVLRNEYKRRQAAPGVKITRRAFGRERRYPMTSGFARLDPKYL